MHIKYLSIQEFETFVNKNILGNCYQTFEYASLAKENGFNYSLVGLVDEHNHVKAASLIIIKPLTKFLKYGYAPKGFILDYFNKDLLNTFTNMLIDFFKKKLVFIKINPEIAIAEIDIKTKEKTYNENVKIKGNLIKEGYVKLKDNLYFESQVPKYNGIVNLKDFSLNNLDKNTRNKIKRATNKGLEIEITDYFGIDTLYNFIKRKKNKDNYYYKKYYKAFNYSKNIDLFLVSLNKEEFLYNSKILYEEEQNRNIDLANKLIEERSSKNLNVKMESDRKLLAYKNDILDAQNKLNKKEKIYIAGALVVKYQNRINIVISGYDKKYKRFSPNYFLHYKILEHYKKNFEYADLNGMTGDFTKNNPYNGLNKFKLGFKPKVYEFIGEYDLPIKQNVYKYLLKRGYLAKKFNRDHTKTK